jgi:hypothetical protein
MTTCWQTKIAGFDIKLRQSTKPSVFEVTYGTQTAPFLSYMEAAQQLGAAIMHALVYEGKVEDDLR